ncbi:MAG: formylglycine-generating enzyme family protein [bacterium]|nr:formylglycine-generating enzyme family protein [bacterium]
MKPYPLLLTGILYAVLCNFYYVDKYSNPPPPHVGDHESICITFRYLSKQVEFISIEPGEFEMGSNIGAKDEQPIHVVKLNPFEISKYEITNEQYCDFLNDGGLTPEEVQSLINLESDFCLIRFDADSFSPLKDKELLPVVEVSWFGANAYARWKGGRLPTEAEWEFAACGGAKTNNTKESDSCLLEDLAWYDVNSNRQLHQVGTRNPNKLGLYDMRGNVWEWCHDWYNEAYYQNSPVENPTGAENGVYRSLRGGSCDLNKYIIRVTNRSKCKPSTTNNTIGFRIVR